MQITVTLKLPPEIEAKLRAEPLDLTTPATQSVALEIYRRGYIQLLELSQILSLDIISTTELLQRHRIYRGSLTMEDLEADRQTLDELFNKAPRGNTP